MKYARKDLQKEMQDLRFKLKLLLRRNVEGRQRSAVLLRDVEQKIEDQFAKLDSIQSTNEFAAIKLRKKLLQQPPTSDVSVSVNHDNCERNQAST